MINLLKLTILLIYVLSSCASAKNLIVNSKKHEICKRIDNEAAEASMLFDYIIVKLCTADNKCIEVKCYLNKTK